MHVRAHCAIMCSSVLRNRAILSVYVYDLTDNLAARRLMIPFDGRPVSAHDGIKRVLMVHRVTVVRIVCRFECAARTRSCAKSPADRDLGSDVKRVVLRE